MIIKNEIINAYVIISLIIPLLFKEKLTNKKRDKTKNLDIKMPENYYPHDNIYELPILSWRMASQLLYSNWINYYVYQESPYLISSIGEQ